jgi:GNAT superfamily N-acetyltransferase
VEVRTATENDRETLQELWREFAGTPPPWVERAEEGTFAALDEAIAAGTAMVAEDDGRTIGFAAGLSRGERNAELTEIYVRPHARRSGVGTELVRAVLAALGAPHVTVAVGVDNDGARRFYRGLGFRPEMLVLRLETARHAATGGNIGSVHLQSDDQSSVERAVARFVPRVSASRATVVSAPRNGWISVYDEVADRDPDELRQLGRELSNVIGTVVIAIGVEQEQIVRYLAFDHGRVVDEYLSVPDFHGPIAPGDAVGMRANPTVMARLTGADPGAVRSVARTAASPTELPPARQHAAQIAEVLGLTGADIGFEDARTLDGAVLVEHR